MGDEIYYKNWRIDVMHGVAGWDALIYRPSSPLHEVSVPHNGDRGAVIAAAKACIDKLLAS